MICLKPCDVCIGCAAHIRCASCENLHPHYCSTEVTSRMHYLDKMIQEVLGSKTGKEVKALAHRLWYTAKIDNMVAVCDIHDYGFADTSNIDLEDEKRETLGRERLHVVFRLSATPWLFRCCSFSIMDCRAARWNTDQ